MHSERRWDLGSKRRLRKLKLRGNGPNLWPLILLGVAVLALWIFSLVVRGHLTGR